ncbi:MAG: hypothetical protein SGILL_010874 [Bacillariaceae sp.]
MPPQECLKLPSTSNAAPDKRIDVLLFDLDGTLYDHGCGYEEEIHGNIFKFMVETAGDKFDDITSIEQAQRIWQPIFDKYNLTKRGLIGEGYVFDSKHYDEFVRKGAEKYFAKDDELRGFLKSFPARMKKVIFTNAPESSANEILSLLGVRDLFDDVLGTDFMESKYCKPEREAFQKVLDHLKIPPSEHRRVCYFEDSFKNLKAGKELGFRTVFIESQTLANEGSSKDDLEAQQFDAVLLGKVDMRLHALLPKLWEE